jgi:integrase
VTCQRCGTQLPDGSRRDRRYCTSKCRAWASIERRKANIPCPPRWQHPALDTDDPALRAAVAHAQQLGEAHGWNRSTTRLVLDGLVAVLAHRPDGKLVTLAEIRTRTPRHASNPRVAEVLAELGLLDTCGDASQGARSWINRRVAELPTGFAEVVRAWLLVLLDGDARTRPRAPGSLYVYLGALTPILDQWAPAREHLREITTDDIATALEPLRGWPRRNAITALRSLFRFAKRRGLVFTNPTTRVTLEPISPALIPLTDNEIRTIEQAAANPAQRLIVVFAAVHAARPGQIRRLTLDDVDLPNQRISLAGHPQRLADLTCQVLRAWLEHRRATWPHTPNLHLLISARTALSVDPVSQGYLNFHLGRHGVSVDRIRKDRILHEALTTGADPLHLALVFNLSDTTASRYAAIAEHLLALDEHDGDLPPVDPEFASDEPTALRTLDY